MLKTVVDYINELPSMSFQRYYTNYVMEMQDIGIESEMYSVSKISGLHPLDFETNIYSDLSELMFGEREKCNKS